MSSDTFLGTENESTLLREESTARVSAYGEQYWDVVAIDNLRNADKCTVGLVKFIHDVSPKWQLVRSRDQTFPLKIHCKDETMGVNGKA